MILIKLRFKKCVVEFVAGVKLLLSFNGLLLTSVAPVRSVINTLIVHASLPVEKERSITNSLLLPRLSISDTPFILKALAGTAGYATSFLEAAFGGLAREYPISDVLATLEFKSDDEPYLAEEIRSYIREARD